MTFNLFSVIQLLDKGYLQTATADQSIFMTFDNKEIIAIAKRKGNLYKMMFRQEKSASCMLTVSVKTWHERLAHQNVKYVRNFLKKNSIKYVDDWDNYMCLKAAFTASITVSLIQQTIKLQVNLWI